VSVLSISRNICFSQLAAATAMSLPPATRILRDAKAADKHIGGVRARLARRAAAEFEAGDHAEAMATSAASRPGEHGGDAREAFLRELAT